MSKLLGEPPSKASKQKIKPLAQLDLPKPHSQDISNQDNYLPQKLQQKLYNHFTLFDVQVCEQVLNSGHECLQTASPDDQEAACLHFSGIESPQAKAANAFWDEDASKDLAIIATSEGQYKFSNEGKEISIISLMSMKSTLVENQDSLPNKNAGLKAALMTMTQEQKCSTTLSKNPDNECPHNSAILLPQNPDVLLT
ncbi:hypothetical protein DSO57_1005694 [Entomophthora muscae]|uniref:Uncharacterized protein n=1 Tax=Entomophthora muscae TaxID=34485 RepID=A0ACC2TW15_9FUNG|nr:hypothetical protein DSO57_1005694 [Entomophthora muscae]